MSGACEALIESFVPDEIRTALVDCIERLETSPDFAPAGDGRCFDVDGDSRPAVKVAVADCSLEFDLWADLRNPAGPGLHPIGLPELWEFWAHHTVQTSRQTSSLFRVPVSYEQARGWLGRAVIISVMLPISRELLRDYHGWIRRGRPGSPDTVFPRVQRANKILDRAVSMLPGRMDEIRPVVVLSKDNVAKITELTIAPVHRGYGHGPDKGGNFPHKSVAVLTGLGQFGAHRLVLRDEVVGGRVERFVGLIQTVVAFDSGSPGGQEGIRLLTDDWRRQLQTLHRGQPDKLRICRYYDPDPDRRCSACIDVCPSGAVASSLFGVCETKEGRIWDGQLQFDVESCSKWRNQLSAVHGSWACVRCLTACAVEGRRDRKAAEAFAAWGRAGG